MAAQVLPECCSSKSDLMRGASGKKSGASVGSRNVTALYAFHGQKTYARAHREIEEVSLMSSSLRDPTTLSSAPPLTLSCVSSELL